STGSANSLMRGERGRQLFPLAHEPHHLLLGVLALRGRRADLLAVRVERRIAETLADLHEPRLERVDLALDVLETPPQLPHLLRHPPRLPRRPLHVRAVGRRGSGACGVGSGVRGGAKARAPSTHGPAPLPPSAPWAGGGAGRAGRGPGRVGSRTPAPPPRTSRSPAARAASAATRFLAAR